MSIAGGGDDDDRKGAEKTTMSMTVGQALHGKTVIEYPTFFIGEDSSLQQLQRYQVFRSLMKAKIHLLD